MERNEQNPGTRKPYAAPTLNRHGDAAHLTRGSSGWGLENWLWYKSECGCSDPE